MKAKTKISLLSLGFALSMGVVSASIFSDVNIKPIETSAVGENDFNKEICNITLSSSGATASPNVLG